MKDSGLAFRATSGLRSPMSSSISSTLFSRAVPVMKSSLSVPWQSLMTFFVLAASGFLM